MGKKLNPWDDGGENLWPENGIFSAGKVIDFTKLKDHLITLNIFIICFHPTLF